MTFLFLGAEGADKLWLEKAKKMGFDVNEYLPNNYIENNDTFKITKEVNEKILHRRFPTNKPFVNKLLMRNTEAAINADSLYAVGYLNEDKTLPEGGTAWPIACFMLFKKNDPIYIYDQKSMRWRKYKNERFKKIREKPPKPEGKWMGIGSRAILPCGENEINNLWI